MEMRSSRHFYDLLESQDSARSVSDLLSEYLEPSGVNGVFIARLPSQNEALNAHIILDGWNPRWTEEYAAQNYVKHDPVARHLLQTRDPYVWSDICSRRSLTSIERRIMDGAKDAGLVDGLTVPIHGPYKSVTCISFSTRGNRIGKFEQEHMRFLGTLALSRIERIVSTMDLCASAVRPRKGLSAQEVRCLGLAWRGFNSKQIAKQTDLTHRTVDQYLARAMDKLNARNRTDAARLAVEYGYIQNN